MRKPRLFAAALPIAWVASCGPQGCISEQHSSDHLPPGAYVENGCVVTDDVPTERLAYDNGVWTFDGVVFGTSITEDSCIQEEGRDHPVPPRQ